MHSKSDIDIFRFNIEMHLYLSDLMELENIFHMRFFEIKFFNGSYLFRIGLDKCLKYS